MGGVFLSYAADDEKVASLIVTALAASGVPISLAHPQPQPALKQVARELTAARCLVVLWSRHSVKNDLVLAEADYARTRDILVSAVIGKPPLPLGFRGAGLADLTDWTGEANSPHFQVLRRLVEGRLYPSPRNPELPRIFLCYRRDDAPDAAGRLYDRLVDAFGAERVFMDIDSVPLGIDFVDHVTEQIGRCKAVIVMIGKQWRTIKDKKRRRRLDSEDDLVRAEIRAALQHKVPVIPVVNVGARGSVSADTFFARGGQTHEGSYLLAGFDRPSDG